VIKIASRRLFSLLVTLAVYGIFGRFRFLWVKLTLMIVWIDGTLIDDKAALLPATLAGNFLGWGCFSTMGVRHARPLHLARHIARLRDNASRLAMEIAFSDQQIQAALAEVIQQNGVQTGVARLTVIQRGDGRWNKQTGSHFSVLAQEAPPPALLGLRLMISPFRFEARRPLAGIKSTSALDYHLAWQDAQRQGFDEAILLNQNGALCETARANLFWERNGELFTPSLECGCLPGIARQLVLEGAPSLGVTVREGVFSLQELRMADELFLTSATNGPRGVSAVRFADEDADEAYPTSEITLCLQQWWQAVSEQ
jgi:branched-subunit amino acid aminotransferase/4-amino-4-deoxychorismate lyase